MPRGARRYLVFLAVSEVSLFSAFLLPYMLLARGYSVLDVGLLFGAIGAGGAAVRPLLGRLFTFRDLRRALAAVNALEAMAHLLYGVAAVGYAAPLMVVAGGLAARAARLLYFAYPAYERIVLPRERLGEAVACTLVVPEAVGAAVFPAAGLMVDRLGSAGVPAFFLASSLLSLALAAAALAALEPARPASRGEGGGGSVGLTVAARRIAGDCRLRSLAMGEALLTAGWAVAPILAFTYILVERYGASGLLLGVASSAQSLAGAASGTLYTWLQRRLGKPGLMAAGLLGTSVSVAAVALAPPEPLLVAPLFFSLRFWDAAVYMSKAELLYRSLRREESALVASLLSSLRQALATASGPVSGLLSSLSPQAPLLAAPLFLTASGPFYHRALSCRSPREGAS